MTKEEFDLIGSMNMCDEISNEAYKKIMVHCEEQQPCPYWDYELETCRHANIGALVTKPCEDAISRKAVISILKEKWNMFSNANDSMQESIDTIEAIPSVTPIRPKDDVLEKIKAEIEQMNNFDYVEPITVDEILQIIDKYKADKESKE